MRNRHEDWPAYENRECPESWRGIKIRIVEHHGRIIQTARGFETINEEWWLSEGGTRTRLTEEEARVISGGQNGVGLEALGDGRDRPYDLVSPQSEGGAR